ncbi:MAG: phosphate ABC transporter substrate-binding protein [Candidatus Margulisiibacteriota bacterium]|jgi:phosphate transport system substrate-binding protein
MIKKLFGIIGVLCFILMFAPLCNAGNKNMIQIKGSDTMVNLVQSWAEKFMAQNPKYFIAVTGGGSGTGISSLMSKSCDLAMCSRTIKPKEILLAEKRGVEPYEIKIALDGLAVVVNPKNVVSKLTLAQLAAIFSGKITNWKQVGGKDEKIVILSREVNSGTHVYFKEHVLRNNDPKSKVEFAPKALMLSSSQAIADEVAQNSAAIGYYGMGYISKKQKAVAIAKDVNLPFVKPTIDNVISNKYPISRPLFLYCNGKPAGIVKLFLDFALSKEGQKIVIATDFVPLKK